MNTVLKMLLGLLIGGIGVVCFIDNDPAMAKAAYSNLLAHRSDYLLQGDIDSDLAIIRAILPD